MLVDTHCHIADPDFDADRTEVLRRADEAGVKVILSVGCDLSSSCRAIRLAEKLVNIFATAGVHPHEVGKMTEEDLGQLRNLSRHPKVVAFGEIGLDFHYDYSPRPVQQQRLRDQLSLASDLSLPLVIHTREAWSETFGILTEMRTDRLGGVFHCFTGGPAEAERALGLGFLVSFSGILTFPRAKPIQAAAKETPLERILIETDSPYLAPQGFRGKRNEPAWVSHVAKFLADIKEISYEEVAKSTSENAKRLFFSRYPDFPLNFK